LGGNFQGVGNMTNCAEFNFWCDPEAASIVLKESKCPVSILPLESCLEASKSTPLQDWRLKVLSNNQNPITTFMDPIDQNVEVDGNFAAFDAYLVACCLFPKSMTKVQQTYVSVELAGNFTRGQMVIDHQKVEKPNATVIQKIDAEKFKQFLLWICGHEVEF
jgi:inosine-uridine nucleoside N-ribohydrolase